MILIVVFDSEHDTGHLSASDKGRRRQALKALSAFW